MGTVREGVKNSMGVCHLNFSDHDLGNFRMSSRLMRYWSCSWVLGSGEWRVARRSPVYMVLKLGALELYFIVEWRGKKENCEVCSSGGKVSFQSHCF
jgi:hypothetical protein